MGEGQPYQQKVITLEMVCRVREPRKGRRNNPFDARTQIHEEDSGTETFLYCACMGEAAATLYII